jgi:diaminopimelate decarboxylase
VSAAKSNTPDRPPGFTYRKEGGGLFGRKLERSILYCDGISLPRLAEKYGTPLYVYSASMIRERFREFDRAFRKTPHTVCYSIKANSNLAILKLLGRLGCGFDVVSGGELERVLRVDRRLVRKVVFSGVGKSAQEMDTALRSGILMFNVESEAELWTLASRAAELKKTARVALRVNPDVPAATHPYISTGLHEHKFGIPLREARLLYARARETRYIKILGVSVHIGSQITSVEPFQAAMERVADLVHHLQREGHRIEYVDAGGGLGIGYGETASLPDFHDYLAQYAAAVMRPLRGLKVHLLLEPGRVILGPAGALVASVLYRKHNDGKRFVVADAAMNDLIRPSLYNAYHEIVPVAQTHQAELATTRCDVVGPICESGDFLGRDRQLPALEAGDLIAVLDAGSYGMSLASNYNSRPRPAEILVDGRSARLIRQRESLRDLMRDEIL